MRLITLLALITATFSLTAKNLDMDLALEGDYTIGMYNSDYHTIGEAVAAMETYGIKNNVNFRIQPGIYKEQILLSDKVDRLSESNMITFQSSTAQMGDVVITYHIDDEKANYILKLEDASNVVFGNLTFKVIGQDFGRIVEISKSSDYVYFTNCTFEGVSTASDDDQFAVFYSPYKVNADNLTIEHCFFFNGSYGVKLGGVGLTRVQQNLKLKDNSFYNQSTVAIYAEFQDNLFISDNTIQAIQMKPEYAGIHIANCDENLRIEDNEVNIKGGKYGIFVNDCYASENFSGIIRQNTITMNRINYGIGIEVSGMTAYQEFTGNKVRFDGEDMAGLEFSYSNGAVGEGVVFEKNLYYDGANYQSIDKLKSTSANADH